MESGIQTTGICGLNACDIYYDGIDVSILCSFPPVLTSLNLQSTFWGLYDYTNITFYMAIRKRSCNGYIFLVIYAKYCSVDEMMGRLWN